MALFRTAWTGSQSEGVTKRVGDQGGASRKKRLATGSIGRPHTEEDCKQSTAFKLEQRGLSAKATVKGASVERKGNLKKKFIEKAEPGLGERHRPFNCRQRSRAD